MLSVGCATAILSRDRQGYFRKTFMSSRLWPLQVFDPKAEFAIVERKLPHWAQAGTLCFITWRTADSIPRSILNRWHADREVWLRKHEIDPRNPDWKSCFFELETGLQGEFVRMFSNRWHQHLDRCHGECVLRQPALSQIVADSLQKFDGDRYELTDFVVMPNHIHLIAAFADVEGMLAQCESWKQYTARQINRQLEQSGTFWQQDGFDHLIRSEEQFHSFHKYIAENGAKAKLPVDADRHFSKSLGVGDRKK
jgi:putative transposase